MCLKSLDLLPAMPLEMILLKLTLLEMLQLRRL